MAKAKATALEAPKVIRYGFYHDADACNEVLSVSNCVENTFFVVFDGMFTGDNYLVDVEINGHVYSAIAANAPTNHHQLYWRLGTSKDDTGFDFVDFEPVSEATETWPTVTEAPINATMTVSTFTGSSDTYPSSTNVVEGVNGKPISGVSLVIDTANSTDNSITPEEDNMDGVTPEVANKGCQFDVATASAVHGKKLLVMISDKEGNLLGISGQQDTTFTIEAETTEAATKDGSGEWVTKTQGQKSWNSSVNGLFALDDEGHHLIAKALKNGTMLCYGLYCREVQDDKYLYSPVRKGTAFPTSNELSAPSDDNATYSINFEGTGEVWMREAADPSDIEAMSFTTDID